jgi:MFS family permease
MTSRYHVITIAIRRWRAEWHASAAPESDEPSRFILLPAILAPQSPRLTTSLILLVAVVRLPSAVLVLVMSNAGFLSGVIAPSREMLVRSAAQPGAEGRVFGIVSTGFNIGGVARPVLFGWLLDHAVPQFVFGTSVVFMVLTVGLPLFQERRRPAAPMDGRIIR